MLTALTSQRFRIKNSDHEFISIVNVKISMAALLKIKCQLMSCHEILYYFFFVYVVVLTGLIYLYSLVIVLQCLPDEPRSSRNLKLSVANGELQVFISISDINFS